MIITKPIQKITRFNMTGGAAILISGKKLEDEAGVVLLKTTSRPVSPKPVTSRPTSLPAFFSHNSERYLNSLLLKQSYNFLNENFNN